MKRTLVFILFFFLLSAIYSENTVYELGPKSENIIVFTASRNQNNEPTFSTELLENFAKELKDTVLQMRVIIAITDNDFPDLPETINIIEHQNTKKLISEINSSKSSVVFMLSQGPIDRAVLVPGGLKNTCPPWMLKDLQTALQAQKIPFVFNFNIILYRLGIINDKILDEYLKENIPAIKISYGSDIRPVLRYLINIYSNGISSEWDKHYNVKEIFGLRIISEKAMVSLIIGVTIAALFYIFIFSFLFGKKREKNIRDLLSLWRVPIFFFIINLFALYIGEYLSILVFSFKFGFESSIDFLPITAIVLKLLFTALISSFFIYINKYLKLPNNTFIYGYLASIICFFNIFIFSIIDLSFSIILLEIYILSFISYHFQKLSYQILFFILNILLFLYYFSDIFFLKDNIINVLFYYNNILTALFILPYTLMFIRFFIELKNEFSNIKSITTTIIGTTASFSILCIAIILIYPSFLHPPKKQEFILYNISKENNYISLISSIKGKIENIDADKEFPELSMIKEDDFIKIKARSENYLERIIGEINIVPLIKSAVMQISISRSDGFPIYEANMEFKKSNDGKNAEFVSPLNLTEPFSIKFSGEKNAVLHIKILAWFYDNPLNPSFEISNENFKTKKMIFHVIKEFYLFPGVEI